MRPRPSLACSPTDFLRESLGLTNIVKAIHSAAGTMRAPAGAQGGWIMAQGPLPGEAAAEESAVGTLTETSVEMGRYIGSRMLRKEDARLVTGHGRYLDDLALPGMVWMVVVRSPMAHARIGRVDTSSALQLPGVVAAYSGADLASEWAAGLPCAWPITPETRIPTHWPVAQDKARLAGDPVAVVVADTREHAVDAAEAVDVDYEQL